MRRSGGNPGDPSFVWLTIVMLAAFGIGLTNPYQMGPPSEIANAAEMPMAVPAAFAPASDEPTTPPMAGPTALAIVEAPQRTATGALAIVIDDLGGSPEVSARAAALPKSVTLSFLPLGPAVAPQAEAARALGHEVLLHLPMEAINEDAGPGALKLGDPIPTLAAKTRAGLALVPGAIGINNHMGSRFTADASAVSRLAQALRGLDLIFLDSRTNMTSLAARFARGAGLRVVERESFIDHAGATQEDVLAALASAEEIARKKASIVVIGHPYPSTLSALETWSAGSTGSDIVLVSLSEHVRRNTVGGGRIASLERAPASAY